MSEISECIKHDIASEALWAKDSVKAKMAEVTSISTTVRMIQSNEPSTEISENGCDLNKDKLRCGASDDNLKEIGDGCYSGNNLNMKDCGGCKNCKCTNSSSIKRRCSTSDITFQASDLFTNPNFIPIKKNLLTGARSSEKIEKINLANLVFNPNFKNSAGCVNLPVIRAGQNLAQKNAQRSALNLAKEVNNANNFNELNQLTQQAAIDLITQQLQPQSLTKLNVKLQQMAQQRKMKGSNPDITDLENGGIDVGDIIHTFSGKSQPPSQSNALRYKTELCRSYEEGGECRFGTACTFAHGPEEVRPVPRHPLYKTEFCRTYHQHGYCQYGTRCHFLHDADEADKSAPLKGCKSWGRHDQLSGALLSLASSSGLLEGKPQGPATAENDVLLANLRRLYALRTMNGQEKHETSNQFSMTQPMAQQLSMAHQQMANMSGSQHLPLSMTQPLPMEALQMGLQRAGQMNQRGQISHMGTNNRVETLANDYAWGMPPVSPTYSGLSPFGTYQQFSPLPHHQQYAHYPFSATAPDLSAALNVSPYGVSQPSFSNTVNVGHLLPDQGGNFSSAVSTSNLAKGNVPLNAQTISAQGTAAAMHNPMWPATSAEVSSVIDKELFGFGLDSQTPTYQQFQHPFMQSATQKQHYAVEPSMKTYAPQQSSGHQMRPAEADLMSMINNEKYVKDSRGLRPISEGTEEQDQGVRPKIPKPKSSSNIRHGIET